MKSPAFQFYAADYLADEQVQLMTIEEEGCYIRLLAYCWREGSIPADQDAISKLCKGSKSFPVVVEQCFTVDPKNTTRLINKRLRIEARKQEKYRRDKQRAGVESGKSRRKKGIRAEQVFDSVQTKDEQKRTLQLSSSSSSSPSGVCEIRKAPHAPNHKEAAKAIAGQIEEAWAAPDVVQIAEDLVRDIHPNHPEFSDRNRAVMAAAKELAGCLNPVEQADIMRTTHHEHCAEWNAKRRRDPGAWVPFLDAWFSSGMYAQKMPARASPVPVVPDNRPLNEQFAR